MVPAVSEWLNLLLRWTHVFAGILWIGSTWFFAWLDGRLHQEESNKDRIPQVWMVHSGGFYVVEKRGQPDLGRALHWFRFEAAITWLSGLLLLALVYYHGGLMVDTDVADISEGAALAIGIGALIFSWPLYDGLMNSPIGRDDRLAAAAGFLLISASAYGLTQWLSARAAYMHVGAILGGLMTANVWMRILPAQRKMIAATSAGKEPDAKLAARAKLRSKQNTFMVVPVVFIMISNHYPAISYGHRYNWVILSALVLIGFVVAKFIRRA